jgi:hypothetical protein
MPRPYQHGFGPSWILLGRWDQACNCHEWRDARQILESTVKSFFWGNELFLKSALCVTAKRFLKCCRDQLEALKALAKPLSVVDSQSATRRRSEYREVLQGMCELKLDIDPSWWKYLLQGSMWTEEGNGTMTSQAPVSQTESFPNRNPAGISNSAIAYQLLLGHTQETTTDPEKPGSQSYYHSGAIRHLLER